MNRDGVSATVLMQMLLLLLLQLSAGVRWMHRSMLLLLCVWRLSVEKIREQLIASFLPPQRIQQIVTRQR